MYSIGVDLGGTGIKVGVVDEAANLMATHSRPTGMPRPGEAICDDIVAAIHKTAEDAGIALTEVASIGVGCPGSVNPDTGIVAYANNLEWRDFPLRSYLQSHLPEEIPVQIANDANVAALGEYHAGSAKGASSAVIITLGTGVGSGVVLPSGILTGHNHYGGEFGHTVIQFGGYPCTCGRNGCFESYCSATGLIRLTKEEMGRSPGSIMHQLAEEEGKVSGKTAFQARKLGDEAGIRVTELYLDYLAAGLANVINAIQPEVLSLGGGISKEGDPLLLPLQDKVFGQVYGGKGDKHTQLRLCTLGNDAGIIGAAMLSFH